MRNEVRTLPMQHTAHIKTVCAAPFGVTVQHRCRDAHAQAAYRVDVDVERVLRRRGGGRGEGAAGRVRKMTYAVSS